ncbi:MAG: hypothetical protein HY235_21365, partial [Acidobacteria bacterium]|nr:hypothetical protein [Acidobacteriota bacterium]
TGQIYKLPQTRIAGWAIDNGVPLDPLYATYDREGGTLAIQQRIPALTRAQLSVFDEASWQRHREDLIHESWLARIRN